MPIYEISKDSIIKIEETSFADVGILERTDLQRLLKSQVDVIAPDVLIISEEFGEWEDSRRRIDLLGLDKEANLVVIELKRTEDGGHMELQAIRYSAMISAMTFDQAVNIFGRFLKNENKDGEARETILEFLDWDEENIEEDQFAQNVRIILASANFSKELTTSVLWLREWGIDIQCFRLKPYKDHGRVLMDIQQIIPLKEAEEYQVQVREKTQKERISRNQNRDLTKFNITINGKTGPRLSKRVAIFRVVSHLCDSGISPEEIREVIKKRKNLLFAEAEGQLDSESFIKAVQENREKEGRTFDHGRYFCGEDELIFSNGKTFAFIKMWGASTGETINLLIKSFPDKSIHFEKENESS